MTRLLPAIERRYSVRRFRPTSLTGGEIQSLLEAGRRAPSAANLQPTRVLVVTDREDLAVVRAAAYGVGACTTAPCIMVCMVDLASDSSVAERLGELADLGALEPLDLSSLSSGTGQPFRLKIGREVALLNGAVAVAHIDLQASEMGLGSCWVHHAEFDEIRSHFGIPQEFEILTLLAIGHPDEQAATRPRVASIQWEPEVT